MRNIDHDLQQYISTFVEFTRKHMPTSGFRYISTHDFLLKEGKIFNHEPYTDEEQQFILDAFSGIGPPPKQRECFYNSQSIAIMEAGLGYAEGLVLAVNMPIAIQHAWNTLPSGKPVDVTLRKTDEKNTCRPSKLLERASRNLEHAYMGVDLPADLVRKSWLRNKVSLMLIQDPWMVDILEEKGYPREWRG